MLGGQGVTPEAVKELPFLDAPEPCLYAPGVVVRGGVITMAAVVVAVVVAALLLVEEQAIRDPMPTQQLLIALQ